MIADKKCFGFHEIISIKSALLENYIYSKDFVKKVERCEKVCKGVR